MRMTTVSVDVGQVFYGILSPLMALIAVRRLVVVGFEGPTDVNGSES